MKKTKDQKRMEMDLGEKEETVYTETGRDKLIEDDEIDDWEEGFMEGAEDDGEQAKCANCGAALLEPDDVVETKIKGKLTWFCSNRCLEDYKDRKKIP